MSLFSWLRALGDGFFSAGALCFCCNVLGCYGGSIAGCWGERKGHGDRGKKETEERGNKSGMMKNFPGSDPFPHWKSSFLSGNAVSHPGKWSFPSGKCLPHRGNGLPLRGNGLPHWGNGLPLLGKCSFPSGGMSFCDLGTMRFPRRGIVHPGGETLFPDVGSVGDRPERVTPSPCHHVTVSPCHRVTPPAWASQAQSVSANASKRAVKEESRGLHVYKPKRIGWAAAPADRAYPSRPMFRPGNANERCAFA